MGDIEETMKRKRLVALGVIIVIIAVLFTMWYIRMSPIIASIVAPLECTPSELSETAYNVETSEGLFDLPEGTFIGCDPLHSFILEETREFETTEGPKIIDSGEEIDCESLPHEPNPCTGS